MKKHLILIAGLMSSGLVLSQTTDSLTNTNLKQNEIGLNIAPVVRNLLFNGSVPVTRFSLSYKRYLNERSGIRVVGVVDLVNQDYSRNFVNDRVILLDDSNVVVQRMITPVYISPHLNLGYERLFGKRKFRWFYGADLSFGYAVSQSMIQIIPLIKHPASGPPNSYVEQSIQGETISKTRTSIFSLGISPFFGAKYSLNKRFSVSAQVGADVAYSIQNAVESKSGQKITRNSTVFDFSQNSGILNDISLIYKF